MYSIGKISSVNRSYQQRINVIMWVNDNTNKSVWILTIKIKSKKKIKMNNSKPQNDHQKSSQSSEVQNKHFMYVNI